METTKAIKHLQKDAVLSKVILTNELLSPSVSTNLFRNLLEAIINQQLSNKAAATIFGRFLNLFPQQTIPSPEDILNISEDTLRTAGISRQKVSYLKSLATEISSNNLVLENLQNLADEEVISALTKVKGVGRWTAEMFLMFSLGREDTFSVGDLGLRTAVAKLYGVDREDKAKIEEISKRWSPYRSYACLYLWKSIDSP